MPSSPSACTATVLRRARASVTATRISSTENWGSSQVSVTEVIPPVLQILMKSAPAMSRWRTRRRTSSTPSATGLGSQARFWMRRPAGTHMSPWPPVWEIIAMDTSRRGPSTKPSSMASRKPASAPPMSRAVVTPQARVSARIAVERSTL